MNSYSEPKSKIARLSGLFIVLAAMLWGMTGLFVTRLSLLGLSALGMLLFRAGIAAVCLFFVLLFRDPKLFYFRLRDVWLFLGSGVLAFAMFSFAYSESITASSPAVAAALLYTAPVFVILFSRLLFHEKLTLQKFAAIFLTLLGCFLVSGVFGTEHISGTGILFGLLSGLGYALYTIFGRMGVGRYDTLTVTFYTFLFATAAAILCLLFLPGESLVGTFRAVAAGGAPGFFWTVGYAIVSCLVPYWLYTTGLRCTEPGVAGVLSTVEPVVAAVLGMGFLGEAVLPAKILGILCILSSVAVIEWKCKKT